MLYMCKVLNITLFVLFVGMLILALTGVYEIAIKFGTGTLPLIIPTVCLLVSGICGIVEMRSKYIKRGYDGYTRIQS